MSKLRVALCFSGQMRNFEDCVDSLYTHFLDRDKYDIDVFVSTWRKRGANSTNPGTKNNKLDTITADHIEAQFSNVRKVEIEDFKKVCSDDIYQQIGLLLPMYYKIWRADKLRREYEVANGFTYDWVIRSRPDILFRKDSDFSFEDLDPNVLYHSRGTLKEWSGDKHKLFWKKIWLTPKQYRNIYDKDVTIDKDLVKPMTDTPTGLHDMFAIAKPDIIRAYTDSWLYIENWINSKPRGKFPFDTEPRGANHPHELLIYRMWINNIKTEPLEKVVYLTYRG